ncbi:DUF2301 domain-containing membrane protein [Gloeocapsopsis dulcis]|uniref:DUF2301 domain-containing membrane protein n=1 Tax=Gloeocapsopsis dulcis AAB1 = 1H9 TaxID=1433147 RepID=A0A6N8G425_9CHRO|nr:DUF2301 domain-containing membrane protein [Gloeocapsopsis dulcis]MUL39145.1 hypothetical protein [Gloeocapsopsis dulcis AAB1 = 1H9]WNN90744.1 DUF2301 domain-containing membrane protein [Gloeocapsopsis dulcis]
MTQHASEAIYQGQFGEFTINDSDRTGVIVYRAGLMVAALTFALGSALVLLNYDAVNLQILTPLFACFCIALGVSLLTIHIYLAALHRLLQVFWVIGTLSAVFFAVSSLEPLAITIYNHPTTLFGIGFVFAALTGIYFKEAFCFNRVETKVLTPLVPILLLGHILQVLPVQWEQTMLAVWAIFFIVFALRKVVQPIPPDIGDKSVFAYLKQQGSKTSEF